MDYNDLDEKIWQYCNIDCIAMQKGCCPYVLKQGCPKVPKYLQEAYRKRVCPGFTTEYAIL